MEIARIMAKTASAVPVVLFSARPREELRRLVQELGVVGYIGKSLDADFIVHRVERILRKLASRSATAP